MNNRDCFFIDFSSTAGGPTATSDAQPEISSTSSTTLPEQSPSDQSEETFSPPRYKISAKDNGDLFLSINGTELKMPEELPKLTQIVKNPQLLKVQ